MLRPLFAVVATAAYALEQTEDRVRTEAGGQTDQEYLAEWLFGDHLHRAALAGRLAAQPERELEGENPDDPVHDPAGDKADEGQHPKRVAPRRSVERVVVRPIYIKSR